MKKALFIFATLLGSYLYSQTVEEEQMMINSGEASYNGQEISLSGHVVIQHGLGKISAHHLTVLPLNQIDKKKRFALLKIKDNILIELQGGGQLACQQAEIDYEQLKGVFQGNLEQPDVMYSNKGEKEGSLLRFPLVVKSKRMEVDLVRQPNPEDKSSKTVVKTVLARHHVRVYHQDYLLLADRAFYQRLLSEKAPAAGTLILTAQELHPYCQVTHPSGDRVQAEQIEVDTVKRELYLLKPKGSLSTQQTDETQASIQFSADDLVFNHAKEEWTLHGHVQVNQSGGFHLKTDHQISICQYVHDGKRDIRSLVSPQETELTYVENKRELVHTIKCKGPLIIDHEHLTAQLNSPTDSQGAVLEGSQVYFEDLLGDMYADQVRVDYGWAEGRLNPSKIVLEGHVKLLNRFDGHFQESGSVLQHALADQVEYFPSTQELVLSGQNGGRVLFFDKVNNVQMSAPALKIVRDEKNQKNSIQGLGDVRFTFIEKEMTQLQQHFKKAEKVKK